MRVPKHLQKKVQINLKNPTASTVEYKAVLAKKKKKQKSAP